MKPVVASESSLDARLEGGHVELGPWGVLFAAL
jgi:hypothetical protein